MTIIKVSTYLVNVYAQAENVAVFSVSELSQLLKKAVESQFAQVCVRGEI